MREYDRDGLLEVEAGMGESGVPEPVVAGVE